MLPDPLHVAWSTTPWIGRGFRITPDQAEGHGALVIRVAGTTFRQSDLQESCFAPGSRLTLVPNPGNIHDPLAIEIRDESGHFRVGYVPHDETVAVHAMLQAGPVHAICLWGVG
jgi:HIRAN domain